MAHAGLHCLLDLYGCPRALLDDAHSLSEAIRDAAERAGATWLTGARHRFEPAGVTCVGLLAESHIAIHTWPELGYAAADIFTCGDAAMPEEACRILTDTLQPTRAGLTRIARGTALTAGELRGIDPVSAHIVARPSTGAADAAGPPGGQR